MYDVNTHDVRRFFAHVWQHRLAPLQLDGLQQKALRIIEAHPEYGHYLEDIEQYLDKEWLPEDGEKQPIPAYVATPFPARAKRHRPAPGHPCHPPPTLRPLQRRLGQSRTRYDGSLGRNHLGSATLRTGP
ncbi:hypothetical protein NEISUBOT_05236 [Neisseria subflava NJ9703]|uniref:Uncharacterized protein n=1 Tax=Neisseria subflava NJ9703 TaxID=546268 RepID=A0A9W5IPD1_NEISU|nr:hypothetical protein NEISUBOT_05236 [Neisseria subflava NJ9703]